MVIITKKKRKKRTIAGYYFIKCTKSTNGMYKCEYALDTCGHVDFLANLISFVVLQSSCAVVNFLILVSCKNAIQVRTVCSD